MYFDPRPKEKREDLFDRDEALKKFNESYRFSPIILILGPRRVGKTSLINVALNESNQPFIFVDLFGLPFNPSRMDILRKIEVGFNNLKGPWLTSITKELSRIKGISVMGNSVNFSWKKEKVDIADIFDSIDAWASRENKKFLVAFDEVQSIRGEKMFPALFAHVADRLHNIVLVLSGSEVGLLFDYLQLNDVDSPLYGRYYSEIVLSRFSEEKSLEYLEGGFEQVRMSVGKDLLTYAVEQLDGIVGWLTFLGARCYELKSCTKDLIDKIADEAAKLSRDEVRRLSLRSHRYSVVLNYLASVNEARWAEIKKVLEVKEEHEPTNALVTQILGNLIKMGFLEKEEYAYKISDPLLKRGIKNEPLP